MKNKEYWEKRALLVEDNAFKSSKAYMRRLNKVINDSKKAINSKIDKLYRQHAKNNKLSLIKSKELINGSEYKEWRMSLKEYVKLIKKETKNKKYYLELETLSKRVNVRRLDSLLYQIKAEIDYMYSKQLNLFSECLADVYKESYNQTVYNIQHGTDMYYSFSQVNISDIDKILATKNAGKTYSERIWGTHRAKLYSDVRTEISQGIMIGKTNKEMISNLSVRYNVSKSNTNRLIRTESNFFCNQAEAKSYEETNVKQYQYLATLDNRTSSICRSLDGEVFKLTDMSVGINYPPAHPLCRSTTVPYFDDNYITRTRRNTEGKSVEGAFTTYSEWEKELVK